MRFLRPAKFRLIALLLGLAVLAAGMTVHALSGNLFFWMQAPSGGTYLIPNSSIDTGGGRSSGAGYVLYGTLGQADANLSSGGSYELVGGLRGYLFSPARIFADGFESETTSVEIFKDGFEGL